MEKIEITTTSDKMLNEKAVFTNGTATGLGTTDVVVVPTAAGAVTITPESQARITKIVVTYKIAE